MADNQKITLVSDKFFNEFVIELPISSDEFLSKMLDEKIMAGIKVSDNKVLVTCTELNDDADFENYNKAINKIL